MSVNGNKLVAESNNRLLSQNGGVDIFSVMKLRFFSVPLWSCVTLISAGLPDVEIGVKEWERDVLLRGTGRDFHTWVRVAWGLEIELRLFE